MDEKEIYQCLAPYGDLDQSDDSVDIRSCNPSTPLTPHTPSTPASNDDPSDRASFSISMDSGLGSPSDFSLPGGPEARNVVNLCDLSSPHTESRKSKKASEHINKEKKRRDRIKDSCDQLRVLLPYIRGRKTDMASILEMSVDYMKIVNMCMPQNLQDQIVDILSKDPGLVPNKDRLKRKTSADKQPNSACMSGRLQNSLKSVADSERCILGTKRLKFQHSSVTDSTVMEDTHFEVTNHTDHTVSPFSNQRSFSDLNDQSFSRTFSSVPNYSDGFTAAQQIFNTYTANKSGSYHDSETYHPTYTGESTLYHYYPSLMSNSSRLYPDFLSSGSGLPPTVSGKSLKADLLVCSMDDDKLPHDANNNLNPRTDP